MRISNRTEKTRRGFSFLEILLVASIIGLLAFAVLTTLPEFRKKNDLHSAVELVAGLLSDARIRTLSSQEDSVYGVYFQSDRAVLFRGASYATGTTGNVERILPNSVEISGISLSETDAEVVFKRLTGDTDNDGIITVRIKEGLNASSTIRIGPRGIISIGG